MYKRQSPNVQVSSEIVARLPDVRGRLVARAPDVRGRLVARPPPSVDVLEKKRSDREWAFQMQSYNNVIKKHVGRPATQYIIIDKSKVKPRHVGRTLDEIRKQVKAELLGKRYISPQYLQMQSEINARARGDGPRNRKNGSGDSVVDSSSTQKSVEISIEPSEMNLFKNKRNQKTIDQIHEESPEAKEKALLPQLNKQMHMSIRRGARRSRPLKQVSGSGGCWNMDDTNSTPLKSVEISIDTSKMKLLKNKRNQKTIDQIHEESPEAKEKALLPQLNKQMHMSIRRGARRSRPLKQVSGSGGCWNMDDTNSTPLKSVEISIDTSNMKLLKPFQAVVTSSATALSPSSALAEPDTETPTQPLVPKEPIPEKRTVAEMPTQPLVPKEPIPEKRTVAEMPTQPLVPKEPIPEKRTVAEMTKQPLVPKEPIPEKRTVAETPTQPLVPKEPIPEKRTVAETPTHPLVSKEPIPEKRTDTEIQLSTAADEIVPHVEDVPAQTQELEEGEIADDDEQAPNMDDYFRQMRKIVGREKISSRIRSFQDRKNLRTNKRNRKTIVQIHEESPDAKEKALLAQLNQQMHMSISRGDRRSGPPDHMSGSIDHSEMKLFKPYQAEVTTTSPPALPEEPIPEKMTDTEIQLSTAADEIVPHVEDVPAQTQELEEVEIVDDDEQAVSWWKIGGAAVGAGLVVYAGYCIIKKLTN